jgi:hypothetical protein
MMLALFGLCALGLLALMTVLLTGSPVPSAAPVVPAAAAPATAPEAASGGARALAQALQGGPGAKAGAHTADCEHDHGHAGTPGAEPPVDPLLDAPLSDEEKARGVSFVPGGGRVDFKSKTLVLPAEVCLRQGPIELFACAEGGKDHESVLRVRCRPELVNLNLTLFGLKKGPSRPPAGMPAGDRVQILCAWTIDGKTTTVRAEDLVWNVALNKPMDRVGWTYVGSMFVPEHDVETGKPTGRRVYAAVYGRTLMATFLDSSAIFETPLPEGVDDSVFVVNEKAAPPRGTAVRLIIRLPTPEERDEMAKVEAQVDEQRKTRQPHGMSREQANDSKKAPGDGAKPDGAPPEDPR